MNIFSIIKKKQFGLEHDSEELKFLISSYVKNEVPDFQVSAWLMATFLNGMTDKEMSLYTKEIINSGKKINFNHLKTKYIIDKHSTGGVGDKVSFILGPILASIGCYIPMIAGRGLGHTGGTIDKLESIPGYNTNLNIEKFKSIVENVGISIISQTKEICPADKKLYLLRDLTGTIESIPLICGSIMSKKIAEGIKTLILDVKFGNGAFMETKKDAQKLGKMLKSVGESFKIKVYPFYTNMNQPLGNSSGLWCEIQESIECLKGNGPKDLMEIVTYLAINTLKKLKISDPEKKINHVIKDGSALNKFHDMVNSHSGDVDSLYDKTTNKPKFHKFIYAKKDGFVKSMKTKDIGYSLIEIGAGRKNKLDILDNSAGILFYKKCNCSVIRGDKIAKIFCSDETKLSKGYALLEKSIILNDNN
tara:strand:+ start:2029 stop:3285 length:1257 start_codon:yes stop_codon:yes gene_type:complete